MVKTSRVTYRDRLEYCNIILDDNIRKLIVRFYFNNPEKKKLEIFSIDADGNRVSEQVPINDLNEIYQYADKFKAIAIAYEQKTAAK